jgi:hypothetical protein
MRPCGRFSARTRTEGNNRLTGTHIGVGGLRPRTFTREAGVSNPARKRSFRAARRG